MNDSQITIREFFFANDYEGTITFWRGIEKGMNVGRSDSPEEIQKKLERDPDLFLIAESENQIVGTIIGAFDGRRGIIYHLAVHKNYRGRGIGGQLLAEVEKRLQAKGCLKCLLHVLEGNTEAMEFYKSRGWQRNTDDVVFAKEFFT
ncbi:MAG: GNAT family N-acetyltransferase [Anaerolineales bacterium]|nr:GNAT family N-acetyltransferase [Anaerolineales bacterium]